MKKLLAIYLLVCSGAALAENDNSSYNAQDLKFTGNDLLAACSLINEVTLTSTRTLQTEDYVHIMQCVAYMEGSAQTWRILIDNGLKSPVSFPGDIPDNEQLVRIYVKYLQDNPNELHLSGAVLLHRALKKAFPPS